MESKSENVKYVPGTYAKKRPHVSQIADHCISEWEKHAKINKDIPPPEKMSPQICFSRKIGVGTLEIADIAA